MTVSINGSTGLVFNDGSSQTTAAKVGMINRIINGAMVIDQRNAGASVTIGAAATTYTLDRWWGYADQASKFSIQQNAGAVTPPAGFTNYLGVTSLSAYTVGSSETFIIGQMIEGFNAADLAWGTANASAVTLSFWVRSSLTGTFGATIANSAINRIYPFSFTISAANTWEQKTVTIPGDTSGTWVTNNGLGLRLRFSMGTGATISGTAGSWTSSAVVSVTGATSIVGTNGATFYITGVDLRKGSTGAYPNGANDFDYRDYERELASCQRYFFQSSATSIGRASSGAATYSIGFSLPVVMRSKPSISGASFTVNTGSAGTPAIDPVAAATTNTNFLTLQNTDNNWTTNAYIAFTGGVNAEL